MAAKKDTAIKLNAASLRQMNKNDRVTLLAEKRADLLESKRSLKAQELVNPSKVKKIRREIALIMTVENEPVDTKPTTAGQDKKENE